MQKVRAKKALGQHFLTDVAIAQQIAESIVCPSHCTANPIPVLEIGPGMGMLTQFLLQDSRINLTAIELDKESVAYLVQKFPQLHLISADFLKLDLNMIYPDGEFCVIGNYPYNISSQIFFKVLEYKDRIPVCSGMIQKEVAERIASQPGKKAYGILSVLLQAYYDIEYLFTVHEHVFSPPPKVKSAVIRLTRNSRQSLNCNEALLKTVVKTAFNQRRKQLHNSLKPLFNVESSKLKVELPCGSHQSINYSTFIIQNSTLLSKRPEQLSVEEFIELTNKIDEALCQN